ncbi:MAG: hypothetical protein J5988_13155 [Eubacterium sp.]|nr:hypothetical protein [Eubacterium sp.]
MSKIKDFFYNKENQYKVDVIKDILSWMVVTGLSYLYWMAMLLLISLFLLNVWHVKIDEIVRYSVILMIITSIGYLIKIFHRRRKEKSIM